LRTDAAAARAVAAWAQRLQPLADAVPPAIPPAGAWPKIVMQTRMAQTPSRRTWIALAAAAAVLAVVILASQLLRPPGLVGMAELAPQGGDTAFTVSVVENRARLLVRAGAVQPVADSSYELWVVPADGVPVSLGIVEAAGETEADVPQDKRALLENGVTLAVSLEPQGGSTSGAPTGPVLFVGALATAQ
jgi:anti-sigma-K factor RskA